MRLAVSVRLAVFCMLCASGCGAEPNTDVMPPPSAYDATSFVVLPDTQFYACAYPEIFEAQTRFIAENAPVLGIGIVLHTGDVVDANIKAQWEVASGALHQLDDRVPYLLAPGNHDLSETRSTYLNDYFDSTALRGPHAITMGFLDETRIDNAFAIVQLADKPWLFLGLEFAPRDATLRWASGVLQEHEDLPAVLFTHAHLYSDGARYDRAILPRQPYHPDDYGITPEQGIADGQDIWESLVMPHENVRLILSGHVLPDGIAQKRTQRPSGSVVYELLANFQTCESCPCAEVSGGDGYLRIFRLENGGRSLRVSTYSPHLDHFLRDVENDFELML